MFLNYIKDFIVKKTLKKSLQHLKISHSNSTIKRVGLVVDISFFSQADAIVKLLEGNGIKAHDIQVVLYSDTYKKDVVTTLTSFGANHLQWNSKIASSKVNDFINEKFDLLISYYTIEKAVLLQVTHQSKASFKVGFSAIDSRLNHLMIQTDANNFSLFISELFKYLKILNKI